MRIAHLSFVAAALLCAPVSVYAQADEGGDPETTEGAAEGEAKPAEKTEADAPAQEKFPIRRGFFAESDLGIFLTFGGRNTNDPTLPSRATSNLQPYLGLTLGYDLIHDDSFAFSLGLKLAAAYSAGAGRVSSADMANFQLSELQTRPNDFSILQAGVVAAVAIMVTERIAVTAKVDGGLGVGDPNPNHFAGDPNTPLTSIGAVIGAGGGIEYFTLLNDFSVGLDLRFAFALVDATVPGLSVTIPIKYTF